MNIKNKKVLQQDKLNWMMINFLLKDLLLRIIVLEKVVMKIKTNLSI